MKNHPRFLINREIFISTRELARNYYFQGNIIPVEIKMHALSSRKKAACTVPREHRNIGFALHLIKSIDTAVRRSCEKKK